MSSLVDISATVIVASCWSWSLCVVRLFQFHPAVVSVSLAPSLCYVFLGASYVFLSRLSRWSMASRCVRGYLAVQDLGFSLFD